MWGLQGKRFGEEHGGQRFSCGHSLLFLLGVARSGGGACRALNALNAGAAQAAASRLRLAATQRRCNPSWCLADCNTAVIIVLVSHAAGQSMPPAACTVCCVCQVGVRYSSPIFTAGAAFAPAPAPGAITSAWLVSRLKGVTFGYKLLPDAPGLSLGAVSPGSGQLGETLQRGQQWLLNNGSLAVAYTPPAGAAGGAAGGSQRCCLARRKGRGY